MVFSSSEPASHSKPKMQNVITGSSDRPGSIDEETGEELRYKDCIGYNESYDNIQTTEIEPTSVIVTIIIQRYAHNSLPTSDLQIDCSFTFNNRQLFFFFGNGTSTIGVLSGVHFPIVNDSRSALR